VQEEILPMERSFQEKPLPPGIFPQLKEKLKDTAPFFRDTKLDLNFRTYYFYRYNFDDTKNEAWSLGGSFVYRSGCLLDHFDVGAVAYTSQPLHAPNDRDGTLLLKPGQEGYTVLGQLYGRIKIVDDNFIDLYRYEYNTPYVNKNDGRMTPNTFEAYTFMGAARGTDGAPKLTYGIGYFDKIKPRNSDTFISMSEAAGARVARGVFAAGVNASFPAFSIGAIDYYSNDIINIGYAEAKYILALTERLGLLFSAQFTDQRSVGENLLNGYYFQTNQIGLMIGISYDGGIISLAYSTDAKGADLQNPWSSWPGYTGAQVSFFDRAGEEAFMIKGSYAFSRIGLDGVTAYALWVHGWDAIDPSTKEGVYDQDEYDFDVQWKPKSGDLKGLWFRIRYAHVDQRGAGDASMDELRVIINYDLSLL
ncbi:MAG: OprD family outer membrane porin, partial [bacterium]